MWWVSSDWLRRHTWLAKKEVAWKLGKTLTRRQVGFSVENDDKGIPQQVGRKDLEVIGEREKVKGIQSARREDRVITRHAALHWLS